LRSLISQAVLSIVVITFITYPAVCIKILEVFDCTLKVGDKSYLNASPSNECGTPTHITFQIIAWVMLAVYCLALPLLVMALLWKFRYSENRHIQVVLRFFYDGFKPKRYYWEILIVLRKFLLVVALILGRASGTLDQIYGFLWIVQAALLAHIILHPYLSGRQFRLELWSLLVILITLGVSLFIPTLGRSQSEVITAYFLSSIVLVLNVVIFIGFIFFIGRGLMRKFALRAWKQIVAFYDKLLPNRVHRHPPEYNKTMNFFQMVSESTELDREQLFSSLERWWKLAPNYKRRRMMSVLLSLSKGTPFETFYLKEFQNMKRSSVDSLDSFDSVELPTRDNNSQ